MKTEGGKVAHLAALTHPSYFQWQLRLFPRQPIAHQPPLPPSLPACKILWPVSSSHGQRECTATSPLLFLHIASGKQRRYTSMTHLKLCHQG
eukprot:3854899-Rhodomonas_salina.2